MMNALYKFYFPGLILAVIFMFRPWLEENMTRHMVIELPLLFVVGWLCAYLGGPKLTKTLADWDKLGLPSCIATFFVTMFWMIPAALDLAVLNPQVAFLKVVSLISVGLFLGASWKATTLVIQSFFILNWVWMTMTVGYVLQTIPEQLCAVYLPDQQYWAGLGLMIISSIIVTSWVLNLGFLIKSEHNEFR